MFIILCTQISSAQFINAPGISLVGSSYIKTENGKTWVVLTDPKVQNNKGAAWFKDKIDLTKKQQFSFYAYFGNIMGSYGADGIAFVLQRTGGENAIGGRGGALGFGHYIWENLYDQPKISDPTFAIEFDTFDNPNDSPKYWGDDCAYVNGGFKNHISLVKNGDQGRNGSPCYPIALIFPMDANNQIIDLHSKVYCIIITYDPATKHLQILIDGIIQQFGNNDYYYYDINEIFDPAQTNDPNLQQVFWGITAGTGDFTNLQEVSFDGGIIMMPETNICYGDKIKIETEPIINGLISNIDWEPCTGLDDCHSLTPIANPSETTNYQVTIKTNSGQEITGTTKINVIGKPDNIIIKGYGRLNFNTNQNVKEEEVDWAIKTHDNCGYLFSSQTWSDDLNIGSRQYNKSALAIKTDCNGNIGLNFPNTWANLYIRDYINDGLHDNCVNHINNVYSAQPGVYNSFCGSPLIQRDFLNIPDGFIACGQSKIFPEIKTDFQIMKLAENGTVQGSIAFSWNTIKYENGYYILQTKKDKHHGFLGIGGGNGLNNYYIITKLLNNFNSSDNYKINIDHDIIPNSTEAFVFQLYNRLFKLTKIKENDDGSLILIGSIVDINNSSTRNILIFKLNHAMYFPVIWAYEISSQGAFINEANDIIENKNHDGYFIIGSHYPYQNYNLPQNPNQFRGLILSIKDNGNSAILNWNSSGILLNSVSIPRKALFGYSLKETYDNNLIIALGGPTNTYDQINDNNESSHYLKLDNVYYTNPTDPPVSTIIDGFPNNPYNYEVNLTPPMPGYNMTRNIMNLGFGGFASVLQSSGGQDPQGDLILTTSNNNKLTACSPAYNINTAIIPLAINPLNTSFSRWDINAINPNPLITAIPANIVTYPVCEPIKNCFCEDDYIIVDIKQHSELTQGQINAGTDCCFDFNFKSLPRACNVARIDISTNQQIYNPNYVTLNPSSLISINDLCFSKSDLANRKIYFRYYDQDGHVMCELEKEIRCDCECDDITNSKNLIVDISPVSKTPSECCYDIRIKNELPCAFDFPGIEMFIPRTPLVEGHPETLYDELNSSSFSVNTNEGWAYIPNPIKPPEIYDNNNFIIHLNKTNDKKIINDGQYHIIGHFCISGSHSNLVEKISFKIHNEPDDCPGVATENVSCERNCCDLIPSGTEDYHISITNDAMPCCYILSFHLNDNAQWGYRCYPNSVKISFPGFEKMFTEPSGHFLHGLDVSGKNIINFCIDNPEIMSGNPTQDIIVEFLSSDGSTICNKKLTINTPDCNKNTCCDALIINCEFEWVGEGSHYNFNISYPPYIDCDIYGIEVISTDSQNNTSTLYSQFQQQKIDLNTPIQCDYMARLALYSITINLYDKFGNLICSRIYAISWSCGGFTKESIQDESTNFNISNLVDLRIIYFSCIPNPVTDESIIQYQLNQICDVKIELINLLGEREKEIFNGKNNYNINSLSLNAKNLVKGFYILKLNACGLIKTIPIIIE